jgi:hypothetical protein
MPKVIMKMMTLASGRGGRKKVAKEAQACVKNLFFEQNSLDKNIKWCSSAHCHV